MTQGSGENCQRADVQQIIDDLAMRSMTPTDVSESELGAICQRFEALSHLVMELGHEEVAFLVGTLVPKLKQSSRGEFLSFLRDAVSRIQVRLDQESGSAVESGSVIDAELISDFIVESREHLLSCEELAIALEKNPADQETINGLFRAFHSIKGLAAFLEFHQIQGFAHEVETLLDCARNNELTISSEVIDVILACAQFLAECITAIEAGTPNLTSENEHSLIETIRELVAKRVTAFAVQLANKTRDHVPFDSSVERTMDETPADGKTVSSDNSVIADGDTRNSNGGAKGIKTQPAERYSIRVDTSRLDYLMDMVGELVIAEALARNEIFESARTNATLSRTFAQLSQITSEVQRTTLRMRMIPIGQLFRKTGKIVRDLSRKCGKHVEVEYVGEGTEVDKTIAEELSDPLMHIVRNAVDHGVEGSEERKSNGKNATAKICLSAMHEGSQIVVSISDNGRGLNKQKILEKAIERNLISSLDITDSAINELIFAPGFSTAEAVTTVSGRGVGMDVVRRHVEKLRGRVDVQSVIGKGTTFTIRLPLTRAIIDGLVVGIGTSRYVIPMSFIREIFRPKQSAVSTVTGKGEIVMLHDRLLPIVRLDHALGVHAKQLNPWDAVLILTEADGHHVCLMVDDLIGKQEVVVKSLGKFFANTAGVSGGTILGDGRVGLILDIQGIAEKAS